MDSPSTFEVQSWNSFLEAYLPPRGRKVVFQGIWVGQHSGHQLHHYRGCRDWWCPNNFQSGDTSAGRGCTTLWCYIMAVMSSSWMDSGQSCILESKKRIMPCMFKATPSFPKKIWQLSPGGTRYWLGLQYGLRIWSRATEDTGLGWTTSWTDTSWPAWLNHMPGKSWICECSIRL